MSDTADPTAPTIPGAFVQLIEYRTDRPEDMEEIVTRWVDAIGAQRTARWFITAADRDQARTYIQIVEFPSHSAAMANSDHPATAEFASALRATCDGPLIFRNLDVARATHF